MALASRSAGAPFDADLYQQRGVVRHRLRDFRGAAADFGAAVDCDVGLGPHAAGRSARDGRTRAETAASWNFRGLCESQLGACAAATAAFGKCLQIDPGFKEAWLNLGQAHRDAGDGDSARRAFNACLRVDGAFDQAHHALGLLLYGLGDFAAAQTSFDACVAAAGGPAAAAAGGDGPEDADVVTSSLHYGGLCALALGDHGDAAARFDRALRREPEHVAWYHRELAAYQRSRLDAPAADSDGDVELAPDFKEGHCKRFAPALVAGAAPSRRCPRRGPPPRRVRGGDLRPETRAWLDAGRRLEPWIQLDCAGFLPNARQHRMCGLAALEVAALARGAFDGTAPVAWRGLYEAAARWRRESEPGDAVWWIDRLPDRAFREGFGLQTPLVAGQLEVVRYHPYFPMAFAVVKSELELRTDSAERELEAYKDGRRRPRARPPPAALAAAVDGEIVKADAAMADWRRKLDRAETLEDVYGLCGGRDFWVVAPCGSSIAAGEALEGTRVTLQRSSPDGFDFTIRTPGTPARWGLYDAEMARAWGAAVDAGARVRASRSAGDAAALVDAAATLFYYWVSFGPLSRGSAACGYVVLAGLLVAGGLAAPPPRMPRGRQLDWEAILSPTPAAFLETHAGWLRAGAAAAAEDLLAGLPDHGAAFATLRDRIAALVSE